MELKCLAWNKGPCKLLPSLEVISSVGKLSYFLYFLKQLNQFKPRVVWIILQVFTFQNFVKWPQPPCLLKIEINAKIQLKKFFEESIATNHLINLVDGWFLLNQNLNRNKYPVYSCLHFQNLNYDETCTICMY